MPNTAGLVSPSVGEYLTVAEVAHYLRENIRTTRRRIARGELAYCTPPGSRRILVAESDLVAYMAASRIEPCQER